MGIWVLFIGAVATKIIPVEGENVSSVETLKDGILSATSSKESNDLSGFDVRKDESTVSITVVGASGDLAKKKIFPALFALYYEDCLPKVCIIFIGLLIICSNFLLSLLYKLTQ